jgi:hypothetical protein
VYRHLLTLRPLLLLLPLRPLLVPRLRLVLLLVLVKGCH